MMKREDHIIRHKYLHEMLDELAADFIANTERLLGETSVLELIQWSYQETILPIEYKNHNVK